MTPLEITTGTIAAANGLFTVATNFWKLLGVDEDLKICLRLLETISKDIDYARGLRTRKFNSNEDAELLERVECNIKDLENAARETGKMIEATRVHKSINGSISVARRFSWVFKGKDNFIAQQWTINAVHNRLLQSVTTMETRPDAKLAKQPPPRYEEIVLMSPYESRALAGKSTDLIELEEQELSDVKSEVSEPETESQSAGEEVEFTEEDRINLRFLDQWKS